MTNTRWSIKGREFVHCNCAYGCPCQFNALPTHGDCRAVAIIEIDEGNHGDTRLDGLRCGMIAAWPGAIHEGHGEVVPLIDERASDKQRQALLRILGGQDTEPGSTIFQVFSTTFEKMHDPVFAPIAFELDIDGRVASLTIPGWVKSRGEPLVNPITGEQHRARINLPNGFEYDTCEVGRGFTETKGPIELSLADSHAQFAKLHLTQSGAVH
ncbi:MAG: DUF1326 domain-containing protein [Rhodanobacteraceae bacterium]